jgi:hypothetical protein
MRNVFILYMPPGNAEAMVHYQDTIVSRVPLGRLQRFLKQNLHAKLAGLFGGHRIAVWGSRSGSKNRANFDKMTPGDDVLIVEGKTIRLIGRIAAKTENAELARELWRPVSGKSEEPWELVYSSPTRGS